VKSRRQFTKRRCRRQLKIFIENYPETTGAIIYSTELNADVEYPGKQVAFRKLESLCEGELIANW
jgi:hypothetical protein